MKRFSPLLAAVLVAMAAPALAQDVSAQKAIYKEVEKNLGSYQKVDGNAGTGEVLNGWLDEDNKIVKLVAVSTGRTEEYYAGPDGKLAYVHLNWGDDDHRVDERIYLTPTAILKWIVNGKDAPAESPAELKESLLTFQKDFASYSRDLAPGDAAPAMPATEPSPQPAAKPTSNSAAESRATNPLARPSPAQAKGPARSKAAP